MEKYDQYGNVRNWHKEACRPVGEGVGGRVPPRLPTGKILLPEKEREGKKGEVENKRRKIEKGR